MNKHTFPFISVYPEMPQIPDELRPYLVLDTETTVMSAFAPLFASIEDEKTKTAIATSKALVMDIAWVVSIHGYILKRKSYAVKELIEDASALDMAYYRSKIGIYYDRIERGEMIVKPWNDIVVELCHDMENAIFCAYNAMFDMRAIKYTERYITAKNTPDYGKSFLEFVRGQVWHGEQIANGNRSKGKGKGAPIEPVFTLRGISAPVIDLWDMACDRLINIPLFKKWCMDNRKWSASVEYFTTNAETTYQYIFERPDFTESHTAIDDAMIETQILWKGLEMGEIQPCLGVFPFKKLGTTFYYAEAHPEYAEILAEYLSAYLEKKKDSAYKKRMTKELDRLENISGQYSWETLETE